MSKKRTKPIIDTIPGYTEKQTQYIRGEIIDNEVNGQFYRWLLISATKINDKEIIEKAEKIGLKNKLKPRKNGALIYVY